MAIDTTEKKLSLLSFGLGGYTQPEGDGSFDQGDKQHFLGLYSGILASEAVLVPDRACLHITDAVRYSVVASDAVRYAVLATDEAC